MDGFGVPGNHRRFTGEIDIAEVGVCNRTMGNIGRREEPGAIVPAAIGIDTGIIIGVLRRHVDMGVPEVTGARCTGIRSPVPGRVLCSDSIGINPCLVLDDQGDSYPPGRTTAPVGLTADTIPFIIFCSYGIGHQVSGGFTGVDIETGNTMGMVMVEHEPGTLLVGIEECLGSVTGTGVRHIGDIIHTYSLGIGRVFIRRGDPLVGCPVTDPRGGTSMEVQCCPVLRVIDRTCIHSLRCPSPHPSPWCLPG